MEDKVNLVVITSAIHCITCESIFSPDMRFLQILRTVLTAIEKIPNPYIVLLDTGTMNEIQEIVLSVYVNKIVKYNLRNFTKNAGELFLLYNYFNSDEFKQILPKCNTINKICGRYYFTERFKFNELDLTKNIIRLRIRDGIPPYFDTRYFRIPAIRFDKFWTAMQKYVYEKREECFNCSIENVFYQEKIFEVDDCCTDKHIGVGGQFAWTGEYVED